VTIKIKGDQYIIILLMNIKSFGKNFLKKIGRGSVIKNEYHSITKRNGTKPKGKIFKI